MASNVGGYAVQPVGRSRPSAFDMNASHVSATSTNGDSATADLLREQQMERDRLQMDNFNLAMRVAVLEERLANTKSTYSEDFEAELLQKRVELEERDAKIRQQKEHMMRAVDAIELLKRQLAETQMELERARAQSNLTGEMETLRHVLAKTEEELQLRAQRAYELEAEVASSNEEKTALRVRYEEAHGVAKRLESEVNQLRQKIQQLDQQQMKGTMQVEQLQSVGKHREEQLREMNGRLEQVTQEKQQLELKYQAQLKRMEDQMRSQLDKLQQEGEKYHTEFLRVNTDREKLQFERERFATEIESVKQDKTRYQAEWERIAKEMDRVNAEVESLRIQNVKLAATCEHQTQTLESYKAERESTADNLHKLETEAKEWRKLSSEREIALKTYEMRFKSAEEEVLRLQGRLENLTNQQQQSANERLLALEQGKNAAEGQNYELRKTVSSLQHQLEVMQSKCQSYETRLSEESAQSKLMKARLVELERELRQRTSHTDQLERELSLVRDSSVSENARLQQFSEQISRLTSERDHLFDTLATERSRIEALQKSHLAVESQSGQMTKQVDDLGQQIRDILGLSSVELNYRSLDVLLHEVKLTLERRFKADSDVFMRRWQDEVDILRDNLDQLSSKLHVCHMKLEAAQRASLHAKDDATSIERSWLQKYEILRSESDSIRRRLEDELRSEKAKNARLESDLSQLTADVDSLERTRQGTLGDLEREILDLKESNRLLLGELQERRRSAEHARKQYLKAIAENKDLLGAVDILKNGITDRDKQIEYYKATILRTTQQLQRSGSMNEVKQKLLEQLEQTQFMVNETYKKWSHSEIGMEFNAFHPSSTNDGGHVAWVVQVDEYVGRLEVICDRWREYIQQSRDLQRRYGEAWRSAALSFGRGKDRPAWVDELERKCSRLLTESVRVSEAMHDVIGDVINAVQNVRSSADRKQRRSRSGEKIRRSTHDRYDLSPLRENNPSDDALSLEHFNGDVFGTKGALDVNNNSPRHEISYMNRGKRISVATSRGSRTSVSRGTTSAIYGHSLASLGRIGDELKVIEKKIKTYPDE